MFWVQIPTEAHITDILYNIKYIHYIIKGCANMGWNDEYKPDEREELDILEDNMRRDEERLNRMRFMNLQGGKIIDPVCCICGTKPKVLKWPDDKQLYCPDCYNNHYLPDHPDENKK